MRLHEISKISEHISEAQLQYVLDMFEDRTGSFEDSVTLPYRLGMVARDEGQGKTVIINITAGPHDNEPCVLIKAKPFSG